MKLIYKYMQNHYIFSSFLVNLILFIIPCAFGLIKYEVSDDFVMELIASGVYGEPSPFIMFMNPLIGQALSTLYKMFPLINWYLWFQLLAIYFSFSIIGVYLLKQKNKQTFAFFWIFLLIFSLDMYQLIQFTKTSTLCVIAGGFLFYEYFIGKERENEFLILSIVFVIVGTMIRKQCLYLGASLLFIESIIFLYLNRDKFILYLKKQIKYIMILLFFLFGIFGYNKLYLHLNNEYKEYMEFNDTRAMIVDYPTPPYSNLETELTQAGISENDYEMFRQWIFFDSDFFDTEQAKKILNAVQNNRYLSRKSIKETIKELYQRKYWLYLGFWACLLIFLILCLYIPKSTLFGIFLSCLGVLLLFYFLYNGRLVYRVEFSVFMEVASSLILLSSFFKNQTSNNKIFSIIVIFFIGIGMVLKLYYSLPSKNIENSYDIMFISWDNDLRKYQLNFNNNDLTDLKKFFKENPEKTFYLSFQSLIQTYYLSFDIFDSYKIEGFENAIYMAGVDTNNPAKNKLLNDKGIENIAEDLLGPNSYFVARYEQDLILKYFQEHFNEKLELCKLDDLNGFSIWKIVTIQR